MEKIKDVQGLLMEAMTNFAIAEKAGDCFTSGYYMGRVIPIWMCWEDILC